MVADAYSSAKKGEWIIGRGWINDTWDDPSFPTKEDLDAVAPDSPVYLTRACGHAAWANTKAFETAGITKDTPDPAGGENFYISRMEASLVWLLIRRRIHLIKRYHRIQRNGSRRSYCWPSRNSFQMV